MHNKIDTTDDSVVCNMAALQDTPVFKFNSNTLEEIRKELHLDKDGTLDQMIDNFEEWISKQNHFTRKKFDRRYLEVLIVARKGSLERAKNTLDKLCTFKTLLPNLFAVHNVKDLADCTGFALVSVVPKLLPNNYRLCFLKILSCNFDTSSLLDLHRLAILMCEYDRIVDYTLGYSILIDTRDVNEIKCIAKLNIVDLRNCISVLTEGYGYRICAIHLLSSSKSIEILLGFLKQLFSPKLASRIHFHHNVESIYEHIPKSYLRKDYGGDELPFNKLQENHVREIGRDKFVPILKEMCKSGTDENYRLSDKYNDEILGMPGSFRTLKLD